MTTSEDALSAHRVRSNSWPEPIAYDGHGSPLYAWQTANTAPLIAAVKAVYQALEDKQ